MSKTEARNGNRVFDAMLRMTQSALQNRMAVWFSAKMVSGGAGVSKPTAIKYLGLMCETGTIEKIHIGRYVFYKFPEVS